ncbi:MAG: YggS family pyridoxal phosphate-dependent enzyme [Planctomycetota bacterium]
MLGDVRPATSETTEPASLADRYRAVKQRVSDAAARSGRQEKDVIVVAVSKYSSIDQIRELVRLGHTDFGENQVQQLIQRAAQMDEYLTRFRELHRDQPADRMPQVRWHMVGHLQRNKVKKALPIVRLVHSVDSLRLAEEIQTAGTRLDTPVEVLVQVNVSNERQKYGIAPAATRHLLDQIDTMLNIRARGMMAMAPLSENPEDARPVFTRAAELFEEIRKHRKGERFDILSMGMSNDFEVAIECGANMVRVGSAIFGDKTETDD